MGKQSKKKHSSFRNNPPRGNPGMLAVCETGRESKCLREAMEILRHYFYAEESDESTKSQSAEGEAEVEERHLSLEEEIKLLKKGASADAVLSGVSDPTKKQEVPFRVYDTGCRGTVFIMCTLPNSELISTTISTAKPMHSKDEKIGQRKHNIEDGKKKEENDVTETNNETNGTKRKLDKVDTSASTNYTVSTIKKKKANDDKNVKWDPIQAIKKIFDDIQSGCTDAPRSRFVARMIPMQVTCFASLEEISANARELIKDFLLPKAKESIMGNKLRSFKIEFKRRNCNHIGREQVVDAIANIVKDLSMDFWKKEKNEECKEGDPKSLFRVDLGSPDYTIIVEICRTLCGMSVVSNANSFKRFNLIVCQEEYHSKVTSTDS